MNFGSSLQLYALDVELLQGIINWLHEALPSFRRVVGPDESYILELDIPQLEIRDGGDFRLGIHLTGQLFLEGQINPFVFDTWARLRPAVSANQDGSPVGVLVFDAIEEVTPAEAETPVGDAFGPEGPIGSALDALKLEVFQGLAESVHGQLFPEGTPFSFDHFSTAFYLGRPASMDRPVWGLRREGDGWVPDLQFDFSDVTKAALVASVALAGEDAVPPDSPSIVRPSTGIALVTTNRLFDARFTRQEAEMIGQEMEGLTIDRFRVTTTSYGFDIDGAGHRTGADISFAGSLVAQFRGGTGGQLVMKSTVETDVDTHGWVDALSILAAVVPGLGWILGDIFIWSPTAAAPGEVENALLDRFLTPLSAAAQDLANSFQVSIIPTQAFLSDLWFFDGNMGVAVSAFAGTRTLTVNGVTRDVAYLAKNPETGRPTNRRRPVESVYEIILSDGRHLKPWQAGQLVKDDLLLIPGHHAVEHPLAKGGVYLRSNPDSTTANNLLD